MASRRPASRAGGSSRSAGGRSGGRSRRPAAQASNTTPILIGGVLVLALVVVVAMSTMGGKDPAEEKAAAPGPSASSQVPAEAAARKSTPTPAAKGGTDPLKPAPALSDDVLTKADQYYAAAKKLQNDGRRAQASGDNKTFNKLVNDAWEKLEDLDTYIEIYTDWLAEADLEGWRIPGPYVKLQNRLGAYDKLRGRLRRVKSNRQK